MRASLALLALPLAACAPKRWISPDPAADPLAVERDRYACMQETRFIDHSASIDRTGARSDTDLTYDREMFTACMRARGYVLEKPERAPAGPPRMPEPRPVTLGVDAGLGGFHTRTSSIADLTAVPTGGTVTVETSQETGAALASRAGLSIAVAPHELLEVAVRAGASTARATRAGDCQASGASAYCNLDAEPETGWAPYATLGVHARFPPAPRVGAHADLGVTRALAVPAVPTSGEVYDADADTELVADWTAPALGASLLPFARLGVDVDLLYAEPIGVRVGCAADVLLRSPVLHGSARLSGPEDDWSVDGVRATPICTVGLRWSPGG